MEVVYSASRNLYPYLPAAYMSVIEHNPDARVWLLIEDEKLPYDVPANVETVDVSGQGDETRLTVSDTGIGIPPEHQKRVFERFYRVDKSHSKEIGGTGLGLSIVKHGAQVHNAQVELQSEPGVGTTICLVFPGKNAEAR